MHIHDLTPLAQVRDAACSAAAKFVLAFPEDTRPWLADLYPLWIAHLDDNIFSVRETAAIALGDVVRAYQQEALERLLPVLRYALCDAGWRFLACTL